MQIDLMLIAKIDDAPTNPLVYLFRPSAFRNRLNLSKAHAIGKKVFDAIDEDIQMVMKMKAENVPASRYDFDSLTELKALIYDAMYVQFFGEVE